MTSPKRHCRFLPVCCPSFVVSAAGDTSPAAASSTGRQRAARKKRKRLKPRPSHDLSGAAVI
ncbi:hypothetical protein GQ55_1G296200 [Panicum hallii var. hallii]|uniref:Uncharacterized protein n=1 Tax=Panicum hallii var. hallii TaxID=1504633 RepID=A0A2T7F8U6_9POAL|nr:hypothetical protein GQ55_1G296200 [Panicum hallii var. hallii]